MPAENVDLVVTRFLAAEVGHRLSVLGLFHQKMEDKSQILISNYAVSL
jgi:hypothetical protein